MSDSFVVTTEYSNGTKRTLETTDGSAAMREIGNQSYEEESAKTVTLSKNGEAIYKDSIKAYKSTRL